MKFLPSGDLDLSGFVLDSLKWLSENDRVTLHKWTPIILKDTLDNFKRTGKEFVSFDLQREIIEKVEELQKKKNSCSESVGVVSVDVCTSQSAPTAEKTNFGQEYITWLDSKPKGFLSFNDWMFTYHSEVSR
jgi:hypothetical protein